MNTLIKNPVEQGGDNLVVSNYVWILISIIAPILAVVPLLRTRHVSSRASSYGLSHYRFQRITIYVILAWFIINLVTFVSIASFFGGRGVKAWVFGTLWLGYLLGAWVALRAIRGIYLAGSRKPIDNPKTFVI